MVKNFERACIACTGDIVFFSDQDDIWLENKVESIIEVFRCNINCNLVFSNGVLYENGEDLNVTCWDLFKVNKRLKKFKKEQFKIINKGEMVTGATMACRKSFINMCIPFDEKILHDTWLSFNAAALNSIIPLNSVLIKYRKHDNQVVGTSLNDKRAGLVKKNRIERIERVIYYSIKLNKVIELSECNILEKKIKFYELRKKYIKKNLLLRSFILSCFFYKYISHNLGIKCLIADCLAK